MYKQNCLPYRITPCFQLLVSWLDIGGNLTTRYAWSQSVVQHSLFSHLLCISAVNTSCGDLDIPVWTNTIIRVLAVSSEVIASLGILDYCRSEFALRITGVKWLRIVLIVICAYIWLGYTFTANWRWPGYAICRSINPLTIGIVYFCFTCVRKIVRRSRNNVWISRKMSAR